MIFYRSKAGARDRSLRFVRLASGAALTAYPIGALLLAIGPDTLATMIVGYGFILAALINVGLLMTSSTARLVGEDVALLDEYERQLRYRAMTVAYSAFVAMIALAIIYAALASDFGAWLPTTYDEYNGLFWGIGLYSSVLPTACLAWMLDPNDDVSAQAAT